MFLIQAWGELAIFFISLTTLLYPQPAQPLVAAAADAAPLKHALFSLFERALEVPQNTLIARHNTNTAPCCHHNLTACSCTAPLLSPPTRSCEHWQVST